MAAAQRTTAYHREVAGRNVEAILDAAEELLAQGHANISAVAARAGVASGLMTTAHEIGAALGVAVFSAVAVAAGGGIAAGYRHGFIAAAAVAAALAVVAALAVPAVRPAAGTRVAVH